MPESNEGWWRRPTGSPWGDPPAPGDAIPRSLLVFAAVVVLVGVVGAVIRVAAGSSFLASITPLGVVVLMALPIVARAKRNGVTPRR